MAESIKAEMVLLDEKAARRVDGARGLRVTGLQGVLGEAANRRPVELAPAIDSLSMTSVRSSPSQLKATLDRFVNQESTRPVMLAGAMDPVDRGLTQQIRCANCGQSTPGYDIVNYGSIEKGYRHLCSQCFNAEIAEAEGLDRFQHVRFDPIEVADCTGKAHLFHFQARLIGPGVALDAFELRDGTPAGYRFQMIGEPEDDLLVLLGQLIGKIRRALSVAHIGDGEFGLQIADRRVVRGMIGWDGAQQGRVPLLTIDGREITWDEFGRMLMTYEGWQFKLEIRDKSEEL